MIDRRAQAVQNLKQALLPEWEGTGQEPGFSVPPAAQIVDGFDIAIPCFALSKIKKQSPQAVAEALGTKLMQAPSLKVKRFLVIQGFLNLELEGYVWGEELWDRKDDVLVKSRQSLLSRKYVVDFSSPNIAKPFGIGHLRSTNIGASICRILKSLGAEVVRINHLGDWGTQFGKMITAYKKFGSAEFVKGDPVNNLYKLYVEFHQKEKDDPALIDEARDWFVRLEQGDSEARELWTWFKDVSTHEFKRLYDRLRVEFDYVTGESFYNELMKGTVELLEKKGLAKESEGAIVVDLESEKMPPCLIRKADGSTLYATRDLATAEYRAATFLPTHLVYVVGGEQKLHFRQVFKVLEYLGYPWAKNCAHVDFGLIKFPEGKMSTRKGNIILLEDVLDQARDRALEIIDSKLKERGDEHALTDNERAEVAEKVGVGSVIFFDLKAKRTKDVHFSWEEILNFEGDSGPYLQYTVVRLGALLRKANEQGAWTPKAPTLTTIEERNLAQALLGFAPIVESAAEEYEPSMISHYLLELASTFNRFYMNVKILKGDAALKDERLTLVEMTEQTLKQGLALLGIQCPEKM